MDSVIRFAIAEDQEIVRKGVIEIIMAFGGYSLDIEATNGEELYNGLLSAERLPDIVVMDISMPVWDGYDTLDAIRKKWPDLKVLILTMHKHEFAIIKMFRSGANGYLLKDSSPKILKKALQIILDKGLYFSEALPGNLYTRIQEFGVIPSLSEKEIQVLKYCHTNLTYPEIAQKMGLTEHSVTGYKATLFEKFGVNTRAELVICGIQMGLIPMD